MPLTVPADRLSTPPLTFQSFVSAFPGAPPTDLIAGDADGDGLVDLVLLVQRDDEGVPHAEVVTLLNRGVSGSTVTFDQRSHAFVGTPSDLSLGDGQDRVAVLLAREGHERRAGLRSGQ